MLKDAGYGVVAPDLLGYGDTDKPEELEAYSMKRMSGHMAELLKKEGLEKVVGVAHDWGSGLLARVTTYHPECFLGTVFVSVGYIEPGLVHDIGIYTSLYPRVGLTLLTRLKDAFNGLTEQLFGYPTFGYWKWFNTEGAADIFNRNVSMDHSRILILLKTWLASSSFLPYLPYRS